MGTIRKSERITEEEEVMNMQVIAGSLGFNNNVENITVQWVATELFGSFQLQVG